MLVINLVISYIFAVRVLGFFLFFRFGRSDREEKSTALLDCVFRACYCKTVPQVRIFIKLQGFKFFTLKSSCHHLVLHYSKFPSFQGRVDACTVQYAQYAVILRRLHPSDVGQAGSADFEMALQPHCKVCWIDN